MVGRSSPIDLDMLNGRTVLHQPYDSREIASQILSIAFHLSWDGSVFFVHSIRTLH